MEDFYMNITSQNNSYDYWNITSNYSNYDYDYSNNTYDYINNTYDYSNNTYDYSNNTYDYSNNTDDYYDDSDYSDGYYSSLWFITYVVTCVIIGVGLFLTLIAIYTLYSQVQNDHVAPIYIINLLISDIIQFCCMIVEVTPTAPWNIYDIFHIYGSALVASVGFMVCIALERYLVIAHPLWYHFRRSIKISVGVCVLVWVLALVFGLIFYFTYYSYYSDITFTVFLLLPFPLFIFFLGGTLKALSGTRVPSDEKRRIVAVLVLVLLIYTLLFLPTIILELTLIIRDDINFTLDSVSFMFLNVSPLADLILYVFMRKGIIDKLLSSVCCCRMDSDDTNSPSV